MTLAASAPAFGQSVLHAIRESNYVGPDDPDPILGSDALSRGALFIADCALNVGGLACVDLWTLKGAPYQGWTVHNLTDGKIELVLGGCAIHNGPQTIVIDEDGERVTPGPVPDPVRDSIARHQKPGPFHEFISPRGGQTAIFIDHGQSFAPVRPLKGQRLFRDGVKLICSTATAKSAP